MEILAMETTTEKCFLKTAVLNFQNIKKIIYNCSNIFSFPCALLVMETFLHILLLYCVFLLTIVWPNWHPYNKSLKVSQQGKDFFCILEWGSVKCVTREKNCRSGRGNKKGGRGGGRGGGGGDQHFLKKLKEETYLGGHCDLEFSKLLFW